MSRWSEAEAGRLQDSPNAQSHQLQDPLRLPSPEPKCIGVVPWKEGEAHAWHTSPCGEAWRTNSLGCDPSFSSTPHYNTYLFCVLVQVAVQAFLSLLMLNLFFVETASSLEYAPCVQRLAPRSHLLSDGATHPPLIIIACNGGMQACTSWGSGPKIFLFSSIIHSHMLRSTTNTILWHLLAKVAFHVKLQHLITFSKWMHKFSIGAADRYLFFCCNCFQYSICKKKQKSYRQY